MDPFVLRDYALLADGERAALVGPDGNIAWMCFPGFADEALLAGLLGGEGCYRITPEGRHVWGGHYEHGLIWRDRWVVGGDVVECREALAIPGRPRRAVLLRRLLSRSGGARMRVVLDLRAGGGPTHMRDLRCDDHGAWRARVGPTHLAWSGAADARPRADGDATALELELHPGEQHDFVLVVDADEPPDPPDAERAWSGVERAWSARLPALPAVPGRRDARLACAVLHGLTGQRDGTVAVATTAMPERAREGRNFDYRYVWIRDQCYVGQAAARAGVDDLLDSSVRFVTARLLQDGRGLAPAYTTAGDPVPPERELDLPGYPGGRAVVGNRVGNQFQLDAFGEALLLLGAAARRDRLDADGWAAAEVAADAIAERRREPDGGVVGAGSTAVDPQPPDLRRRAERDRRAPAPGRTGRELARAGRPGGRRRGVDRAASVRALAARPGR